VPLKFILEILRLIWELLIFKLEVESTTIPNNVLRKEKVEFLTEKYKAGNVRKLGKLIRSLQNE